MRRPLRITLLLLLASFCSLSAQNTVALTQQDQAQQMPGYNLLYPHNQTEVLLIDNCGRVVNRWDTPDTRPGNFAYLTDNGDVVIGYRPISFAGDAIWAGGGGATIERRDWGNNMIWSYTKNDASARLHHDHAVMPNGNVLAVIWINKDSLEAIAEGRDPSMIPDGNVWPDAIYELQPNAQNGADVVWEWHAWDHMVQDFDSTKNNYGVVSDHPELIDINYGPTKADWHHVNAIDYNAELDQIVLSVPNFDEIWIVDHSTTTAEAASHTGGTSNIGGDLLYRWGNPEAYGMGDSTDKQLFFQHDIHWAVPFLDTTHADYGKMVVFNNRAGADFSTANIFNPSWNSTTKSYEMSNGTYLPAAFDWTYTDPTPQDMYSTGLSSVQLLPNGNKLITVGRFGRSFELNSMDQKIWEYITPIQAGTWLSQGDPAPAMNANLTFRMKRYPWNFAAFDGRTLVGGDYLELNPDTTVCTMPAVAVADLEADKVIKMYPNPAQNELFIEKSDAKSAMIDLYDMQGKLLRSYKGSGYTIKLDLRGITPGMYLVKMNHVAAGKVMVLN